MKNETKQALWIAIYAVLVLAPLAIFLLGLGPERRTIWRELSVGLGFVGLTMMGIQFIPTTRLPFLAEVFPPDDLYRWHHRFSIVASFLTVAHPLVLFIQNPYTLELLNVWTAPWRARAGVASVAVLILLVITSVWRVAIRMSYETWRLLHDVFAVAVIGFGLYHILNVNYYTSVPFQRGLIIGLVALWGLLIFYLRVVKPWTLFQRPYELVELIEERAKTWTIVLEPVGHEGLTFRAGQVAWLSMGHSPFRIEEHPFSFASSAEYPERLGFAIKELGDFTSTIGDMLLGTKVYVDGPYGTFDLSAYPDTDFIFIAGGIGAAPIMSMLRTMADRGDDRSVQFFYGNPTWDTIAFREELAELEEKLNLEVIHVLERPPEDWEGERGFVTKAVLEPRLCEDYRECQFFLCGPPPMLEAVEAALIDLGVSRGHLRHEIRERIHTELYEMA
jgi:predicted ferric reductase